MSQIIALIDGSVYSQSVCDHAAWIARRRESSVELIHAIGRRETSSAPANLSGNITLGARTALLEELSSLDEQRARLFQKRGWAILDDGKARLEAAGVGKVMTRLRIGDVLDAVTDTETDADMIVIGKRGEAADFATLHLGSNLERIARTNKRPVFVASRAFKPIEKPLIAFDGGASSLKAVEYVARDPLFTGLDCHLLLVGTDTAENRRRLDAATGQLEQEGRTITADIMPGQADMVISQAVANQKFDLLVMGAYGHSRMRSLIIGSTTTEMVRSCLIPVVLFR